MRYAALSALTGLAILVGITAGGQAAPEDSIVLVYKVGRRPGTEGEIDLSALAGMLKKRLDPDGAYKRAVRPLGKDQIEIVLPRSLPMAKDGNNKLTADDVQWIKSLVTKAGNLEFR